MPTRQHSRPAHFGWLLWTTLVFQSFVARSFREHFMSSRRHTARSKPAPIGFATCAPETASSSRSSRSFGNIDREPGDSRSCSATITMPDRAGASTEVLYTLTAFAPPIHASPSR
jgi:hypothetical protein